MRTMSLFESHDSNGTVSLSKLFDNKHNIGSKSELSITDIANLIVRGGWPNTLNKKNSIAKDKLLDTVIQLLTLIFVL